MSKRNGCTAAIVLSSGVVAFAAAKKMKNMWDLNNSHVSLTNAYSSVSKATAQQHGIQLVGELESCA